MHNQCVLEMVVSPILRPLVLRFYLLFTRMAFRRRVYILHVYKSFSVFFDGHEKISSVLDARNGHDGRQKSSGKFLGEGSVCKYMVYV